MEEKRWLAVFYKKDESGEIKLNTKVLNKHKTERSALKELGELYQVERTKLTFDEYGKKEGLKSIRPLADPND